MGWFMVAVAVAGLRAAGFFFGGAFLAAGFFLGAAFLAGAFFIAAARDFIAAPPLVARFAVLAFLAFLGAAFLPLDFMEPFAFGLALLFAFDFAIESTPCEMKLVIASGSRDPAW
jgi:hypothetical protein